MSSGIDLTYLTNSDAAALDPVTSSIVFRKVLPEPRKNLEFLVCPTKDFTFSKFI